MSVERIAAGCAALVVTAVIGAAPSKAAPAVTCLGETPTISGTSAGEEIRGTPGADVIDAGDGADVVRGLGGDDLICGGDGSDLLVGGDGGDRLDGGPAGLAVHGDRLQGGAGDDELAGGGHAVADFGTASAAVTVDVRDGVATGEGADTLHGVDAVFGSRFGDRLFGGAGDDLVIGGGGDDLIAPRGGSNRVYPDAGDALGPPDQVGDDVVRSRTEYRLYDHVFPRGGADLISSRSSGNGLIVQGRLDEGAVVRGGSSKDFVRVSGSATVFGGPGVDELRALDQTGAGVTLHGGADADQMSGGVVMYGDDGDDLFDLQATRRSPDDSVPPWVITTERFVGGPGTDQVAYINADNVIHNALELRLRPSGMSLRVERAHEASFETLGVEAVNFDLRRSRYEDPTDVSVTGTDGDDLPLRIFAGNLQADLGDGADRLDASIDRTYGGDVDIDSGPGADTLRIESDDTIPFAAGSASSPPLRSALDTQVRAGPGDDRVFVDGFTTSLGEGDDHFRYDTGGVQVFGLAGDDTFDLVGDGLYDGRFFGGAGDDRMTVGGTLLGGPGDDLLVGEATLDRIDGGDGDDVLRGRLNNDTLTGGPGTDRGDGGPGRDTCDVERATACES